MGCDIHFVLERKDENHGWVGVYATDAVHAHPTGKVYTGSEFKSETAANIYPDIKGRNYVFFGLLAGVRHIGPDPLGMPDDASALARMLSDGWGDDGHSHSYCSLRDFCTKRAIADADGGHADVMRSKIENEDSDKHVDRFFPELYPDHVDQMRVVFWFDN